MKCRGRFYFGPKSMPKPNSSTVISLAPNISSMAFFFLILRLVCWFSESSLTLNSLLWLHKESLGIISSGHINGASTIVFT